MFHKFLNLTVQTIIGDSSWKQNCLMNYRKKIIIQKKKKKKNFNFIKCVKKFVFFLPFKPYVPF